MRGTDLPDYVYLLNSDAFPDPDCVGALVRFLDAHPEAGIAGSYVHGPEPVPHKTAFRFPNVPAELETSLGIGLVSKLLEPWIVALPLPTRTREVDWLAGASMLIRRAVIEQIGLMDDAYFLYYEETDYCLRAHRAGWKTFYVVESSVTHIGSVSTGFKDHSRPTPKFWFASRRYYFLKNHGRLALWAANGLYFFGAVVCRLRYALIGRATKDPRRHLRDFASFNFRLKTPSDDRPPRKVHPGPAGS
jgi:GT2 family glycosyltransferase